MERSWRGYDKLNFKRIGGYGTGTYIHTTESDQLNLAY